MADNPRKPQQATRIDWAEARARFIALPPTERTYARITREFGISGTTIRKYARRDGWVEAAESADQAAFAAAERRARRTRQQRVEKMLELADAALDRYDVEMPNLEVRLADLPAIGKFAELLEGEATDRVSFSELQEALGVTLATLLPFIPKARRALAIAAVREKLGAVDGEVA